MKKTIIISGGEKGGLGFALGYKAEEYTNTYIVACDRGYLYAKEEGIVPNLIIGDFDSYNGQLPSDIPIERLPVEKNDTDTMHAARHVINSESDLVIICCALGGRLDHLLSNIQTARFCAERGVQAIVTGKDSTFYIVHENEIALNRDEDYSLSVLSLSDRSVVSIEGTKYELKDVEITGDFPIGQSNEWKENAAKIKVSSGTVVIITSLLKERN